MSPNYSPPPPRQLPPDRLEQRKRHLLTEIAQDQRPFPWPAITLAPLAGRRRAFVAAAALIVVAVAVGVLVTRGGTGTASAAEVRAKLIAGLRFDRSVRAEFSVRTQTPGPRPRGIPGCVNCTPVIPQPTRFVVGADGSYSSLTLPLNATRRNDVAYNASTGVETSFGQFLGRDNRPLYIRRSHLDPASQRYGPETQLGVWVQGALADRNPEVKNTSFDGRSAWELTVTFTPGEQLYDAYGVRVDVVVDRQTGLVLQVTQYAYSPERWTSIQSVHDLKIGEPTSAADFTVPKPKDAQEVTQDVGFRRVPIAAAAAMVGYQPLLPTNTLGRTQNYFGVAKTSKLLPAPGLPSYHGVVSARYGRSPDSVAITTRRGRSSELLPLLNGLSSRPVHISSGPLAGDYAYVSTSPLSAAFFVSFHHGLLVQITAPSARDAITVAESLQAAH